MRIKTYFSGTVEAALQLARQELGDDAVLLNSRPAPEEYRHLGAYEVVFGADAPHGEPRRDLLKEATPPAADPSLQALSRQVEQLQREMQRLARPALEPAGRHPEWSQLLEFLLEREIRPDLARRIRDRVAVRRRQQENGGPPAPVSRPALPPPEPLFADELRGHPLRSGLWQAPAGAIADLLAESGPTELLLVAELERFCATAPALQPSPPGRCIVAHFLGAPGAGKTTSLMKLAVACGLRLDRPTHILTVDTQRVGASEPLRRFAEIAGLGFQSVETPRALEQAVAEHANKGLLLIDTPGCSPAHLPEWEAWAQRFAAHPEWEGHLVVSATMKNSDLDEVWKRVTLARPSRLLFTHCDEAAYGGNLLGLLERSSLPVSYLTAGPSIPEDIEVASVARLLDFVIGDVPIGPLAVTTWFHTARGASA